MLDIKLIRQNPDQFKTALGRRHINPSLIDSVIEADKRHRDLLGEKETLQAEQNKRSKGGPKDPVELEELKKIKEQIKLLEDETTVVQERLTSLMYSLPNAPFDEVPTGRDEAENVVLREVGERTEFKFQPLSYIELGEKLDLFDTERGAKVSGARFAYLKHEAPILEFALVQFVMERLTSQDFLKKIIKKNKLETVDKPFIPLIPPVMIKPEAFRAMGKLDPGQEEERYYLPKDDLFLVGSGEHTTGAMHWDEFLDQGILPHRHIAFSSCFRREAGSYGKDTRGIMRVHQFDKLEMYSYVDPAHSRAEHDLFLAIQEELMQELEIPYRVMLICTGDMVWTDAKQYDIESWLPSQQVYRETHSTSNSTDFQSRRLNVRYKNAEGKSELVHTLNGTAFAIGRALIAILENYQTAQGTVKIPKALQPYTWGIKEIAR